MYKKHLFQILCLGFLLLWSYPSLFAQSSSYRAKVKEMLELTKYKENFKVGVESMVNNIIKLRPDVPEELWVRMKEEFLGASMEELIDIVSEVYAKHLDEADLDNVIAFYKTPSGSKLAEKSPLINQDVMNAAQDWGKKLGEDFVKKLEEEGY